MEDYHQKEATVNRPVSLSVSTTITSPSSRKLLLSDLKPKQVITTSSLSDEFFKKTRDTPNLSNCHGCGLRINYSNPKERLQTLYSLWRIVLLCKKCFKLVKSAEICSYCFAETSREVCFYCINCKRGIHKDCVVKFRRFPPWSYCRFETRFSYCVDCCEPKLLVRSTLVYKRRNSSVSGNINSLVCNRDISTNGDVDDFDSGECLRNSKSLTVPFELGESTACKKLRICTNGKINEKIYRRKNVSKPIQQGSAGDSRVYEKKTLDVYMEKNIPVKMDAKKEVNHSNCTGDDHTCDEEDDDMDLSFESPKNSKNKCLLNTNFNFDLFELIDRTLPEPSVSLMVSDHDSSAVSGNLLLNLSTAQGSEGISNSAHVNENHDGNHDRYFLKYRKKTDRSKSILGGRNYFKKNQDRYTLKYRKRSIKYKEESKTETGLYRDSLHLENKDSNSTHGKSDNRYFLKYKKKSLGSKKQFQS